MFLDISTMKDNKNYAFEGMFLQHGQIYLREWYKIMMKWTSGIKISGINLTKLRSNQDSTSNRQNYVLQPHFCNSCKSTK